VAGMAAARAPHEACPGNRYSDMMVAVPRQESLCTCSYIVQRYRCLSESAKVGETGK